MKGYGVNVHETKSQINTGLNKAMEQRLYDCSS